MQVQNLPQNHIPDLDLARSLVLDGDLDMLEICYGNVPDTLSQLIRTAFIAKPGHTFIVGELFRYRGPCYRLAGRGGLAYGGIPDAR